MDLDDKLFDEIAAAFARRYFQTGKFYQFDYSTLPEEFRREVMTRAGDDYITQGNPNWAGICYGHAGIENPRERVEKKLLEFGQISALRNSGAMYCRSIDDIPREEIVKATKTAFDNGQLYDALEGFDYLGDKETMRDIARQYAEQGKPDQLISAYERIGEETPRELLIQSADLAWESEDLKDNFSARDVYIMTKHTEGIFKVIYKNISEGDMNFITRLYDATDFEYNGEEIVERFVNEAPHTFWVEKAMETFGISPTQEQFNHMGDRFLREGSLFHALEAYKMAENKDALLRVAHTAAMEKNFFDAGRALKALGYEGINDFMSRLGN